MTRRELIDLVRAKAYCTEEGAASAVDALFAELTERLKRDGSAALPGFGSFKRTSREARMGRNPRTGEALRIKASKSVRFKPAKALKDFAAVGRLALSVRRRRKALAIAEQPRRPLKDDDQDECRDEHPRGRTLEEGRVVAVGNRQRAAEADLHAVAEDEGQQQRRHVEFELAQDVADRPGRDHDPDVEGARLDRVDADHRNQQHAGAR